MPNPPFGRRAFSLTVAAVCAVACDIGPQGRPSPGNNEPDPYNGAIDNRLGLPPTTSVNFTVQTPLSFLSQTTTCTSSTASATCCPTGTGNTPCYRPQVGWVGGNTIEFFNVGAVRVGANPPQLGFQLQPWSNAITYHAGDYATFGGATYKSLQDPNTGNQPDTSSTFWKVQPNQPLVASILTQKRADGGFGAHGYDFPHSCAPAPYNKTADAFVKDVQYPIVDALPLNNSSVSSNYPPTGLLGMYGVTGLAGNACNDLKYAETVTGGSYGAKPTDNPTHYETWMMFDPSIPVFHSTSNSALTQTASPFWFRGLQGTYFSGGNVPVDADGNLIAMDGVILDPTSGSFEVPSADRAIILPFKPGDAGYSPIVLLHDWKLTSGASGASAPFTALCQPGTVCPAKSIDMTPSKWCASGSGCVTAKPFYALYIVASPQ